MANLDDYSMTAFAPWPYDDAQDDTTRRYGEYPSTVEALALVLASLGLIAGAGPGNDDELGRPGL